VPILVAVVSGVMVAVNDDARLVTDEGRAEDIEALIDDAR